MLKILTTVLLLAAATQAFARDEHYDGSDPLLCTAMTAQVCDIHGCEQAGTDNLSGVRHFVVDFKRNRVKAARWEEVDLEAKIDKVSHINHQLFLHGVNEEAGSDQDETRSWTMTIADPTGLMTLTVAGEEVALVMFGACVPVE
jgi:hypothetical protein